MQISRQARHFGLGGLQHALTSNLHRIIVGTRVSARAVLRFQRRRLPTDAALATDASISFDNMTGQVNIGDNALQGCRSWTDLCSRVMFGTLPLPLGMNCWENELSGAQPIQSLKECVESIKGILDWSRHSERFEKSSLIEASLLGTAQRGKPCKYRWLKMAVVWCLRPIQAVSSEALIMAACASPAWPELTTEHFARLRALSICVFSQVCSFVCDDVRAFICAGAR